MAFDDPTKLLLAVQAAGHKVFTRGSYNLNIIGVRSPSRTPNKFDDRLHVVYWDGDGKLAHNSWRITTDPGTYWLENPMNVAGTAILCPGQYRGVYKLGQHRGYDALVQRGGKVKVYRDDNRDDVLDHDEDNAAEGYFGINIHRASTREGGSTRVNKWSAGCQVFADPSDFAVFLSTVKLQTKYHPTWTRFTYTLIEE